MKLLVVTPTLGSSPWLAETVVSVAGCAPGARHVLVAPAEHVDVLGARFEGVQVVPDPGGGMYAAINAGLATGGDWDAFTYINDDDVLLPNFSSVRDHVARGDGVAMAYGRVGLIDVRGRRLGGIPISPLPGWNRRLYEIRTEPVYQHGTIITREAWNRVGAFDTKLRFCGDSDYLARLCLAGVRTSFVGGGEVAAFRLRAGQLTGARDRMEAERSAVDVKLDLLAQKKEANHVVARMIFRLANAYVYAERIRRYGWKRFDEVIVEEGQR